MKRTLGSLIAVAFLLVTASAPIISGSNGDHIGIYFDKECTQKVTEIDCKAYSGSTTVIEIYVRNEGVRPLTLDLSSTANEYIEVSWNCSSSDISVGEIVPVELYVKARDDANPQSLSINVKVMSSSEQEVTVIFNVNADEEGCAVVGVLFNSSINLSGGLGAYTLNLSVTENIIVLGASGGQEPFDKAPTVNKIDGKIVVAGFISEPQGPQMTELTVARVRLRLNGTVHTEESIVPSGLVVVDAASGAEYISSGTGQRLTFLRGDANKDGHVSVTDAMFIAQYLAGNRPASDLNLLNAASVKHDGTSGDRVTIADAMFVAQYLAGLRDDRLDLKEQT